MTWGTLLPCHKQRWWCCKKHAASYNAEINVKKGEVKSLKMVEQFL
jgi:hypothetical protein